MNYWTPVLLLIASNVIYNICSKSTPSGINPLAMLTIVYLIGAILAGVLYYVVGDSSESLLEQYKHLNCAGILCVVVYDFVSAFFCALPKGKRMLMLSRIVCATVCGFFTAFSAFYICNAQMRGYMFFGFLAGMVSYLFSVERAVFRTFLFLWKFFLKIIVFIFKILLTPIRFLHKIIVVFLYRVKKCYCKISTRMRRYIYGKYRAGKKKKEEIIKAFCNSCLRFDCFGHGNRRNKKTAEYKQKQGNHKRVKRSDS